jgi:hypothetical protein
MSQLTIKKFDDYIQNIDYNIFIEQLDSVKDLVINTKLNIILLADRLIGYATALKECLEIQDNFNVTLVTSYEQVNHIIKNHFKPDYLILVGYQQNKNNYDVINLVRETIPGVLITFYAILDAHIIDLSNDYKTSMFDRTAPVKEFIIHLEKDYIKYKRAIQSNVIKPIKKTNVSETKKKGFKYHFFKWKIGGKYE